MCLIKNIKNETSLELWRHSEKYFNDNLRDSCLMVVSSEIFLDTYIYDLTIEELKCIASLKELKCTSKILLENVVKWIKLDFENRQHHIKDLMQFINFDNIDDAEFKKQIFLDKILMQSKEFLTLTVNCLVESILVAPKKTLFVITNAKVYSTDFYRKEFIESTLYPKTTSFGISSYTSSGFITTGGYQNDKCVNLCTQFYPSRSVQKEFPPLLESRYNHRNFTIGTKIYACGGWEKQTVEVFEENVGKWIKGPTMNKTCYWFGAANDNENNLYVLGGKCNSGILSESIEHLDTRTSNWQKIYTDNSIAFGFTTSQYKDNKIYCFGRKKGYIFDIRARKKLLTIPYKLDNTMDFLFHSRGVNAVNDCTMFDNDIYLVGRILSKNVGKTDVLKLNLQTNAWESQNFNDLNNKELQNVCLVWCNTI